MDRLESFGLLRDLDTEAHRVTSVISTGDVARDGAIIEPDGWDFSNYDRNPVVLWMHDDSAMPFARMVDRKTEDDKLIATAEFDMDDPMGATVFRKIQAGYINTTSVRWLPKETEWRKRHEEEDEKVLVFLKQELLEFSFVTIPADPGALIVRADGGALSLADYRQAVPDLSSLGHLSPDVAPEDPTPELGQDPFVSDYPDVLAPHRTPKPDRTPEVERLLVRYFEQKRDRPDVTELIIERLAKHTGKSVDRIRQEMAEGGL